MAKKKIIWAINPYEYSEDMDKRIEVFLKNLTQYMDYDLQPVYVMTSGFAQIRSYIADINYEDLIYKAKRDCKEYLNSFSEVKYKEAIIIENKLALRSSEAKSLEDYLCEIKPDFVCMGSKAKPGLLPGFIGSFVESFLTRTKYLAFVVGPNCNCATDLSRAFLPVEVTEDSAEFISEYLSSKNLDFIKYTSLFHKMGLVDYQETLWSPAFHEIYGGQRFDLEIKAKKEVEKFFEVFKTQQQLMEIKIQISEELGLLPQVILKNVKEDQAGLIVMRSTSGPIMVSLIGSITKEVINKATRPVIIYPYHYEL